MNQATFHSTHFLSWALLKSLNITISISITHPWKFAQFASVYVFMIVWTLQLQTCSLFIEIENTTYKIYFRTIPANTILLALMTLTVLPVPVCQDIQEIYVTQTLMNVLQVNKFIVLWEKSYLNKISCFRSLSQFPWLWQPHSRLHLLLFARVRNY